jgi:hypothetical protein
MMKRSISCVIAILIFLTSIHVPIYGNTQGNIETFDEIKINNSRLNLVQNHYELGLTLNWTNPTAWIPGTSGIISNNPENLGDTHSPIGYEIFYNNLALGQADKYPLNILANEVSSDGGMSWSGDKNLSTGSLYEIRISPYHYHHIKNNEGDITEVRKITAPYLEERSLYLLTEPKVEFEQNEGAISVVWEDMNAPGDIEADEIKYRIRYTSGVAKENKTQFDGDASVIELPLLSRSHEDVERFSDQDGRRWLRYTLSEAARSGTVYSFLVEPELNTYKGRNVYYNRNNPNVWYYLAISDLSYIEYDTTLRLEWYVESTRAGVGGGTANDYHLAEIRLLEIVDNEEAVIAIFGPDAGEKGYYIVNKPKQNTRYRLAITYQQEDNDENILNFLYAQSNEVIYIPLETKMIPSKPFVPTIVNRDKFDAYNEQNQLEEHLLPDALYLNIMDWEKFKESKKGFYLETEGQDYINFVWSAFRRYGIGEESEEMITDLNVAYDIWVTNSIEALETSAPLIADQRYTEVDGDALIRNEIEEDMRNSIRGFHTEINTFYDQNSNTIKPLVPNTLYYIKVQAKKIYGNETLRSEPTILALYYDNDGAVYVPPVMSTPPLKVSDTSETSVTVETQMQWYEIMTFEEANESNNLFDRWMHKVFLREDVQGMLISTEIFEGAQAYVVAYDTTSDKAYLIEEANPASDLIYLDEHTFFVYETQGNHLEAKINYRKIDLGEDSEISSLGFRFRHILYSQVLEEIEASKGTNNPLDFAEYLRQLGAQDEGWKDITNDVLIEDGRIEYTEEGLDPNSRYLFLIQPYREIDGIEEVLKAHYPSSIVVVTDPEDDEVLPTPQVPFLETTNPQEQAIDAYWFYNRAYTYEIRYGRDDDFENSVAFDLLIPDGLSNGKHAFEVNDLFPNTGYYFYIRAINPETGLSSDWSNPVYGKTLDVDNPGYPRGVGIPSDETMEEYNYDAGVGSDYVALEWLKDLGELQYEDTPDNNKVQREYAYKIEVAQNPSFTDAQYIKTGAPNPDIPGNVEDLETTLIKVNELISNRYYYFRLKTVVTITGEEEGQLIVKESLEYSPTLKILVLQSGDEYDGSYDPALEILPSEDFELIYNRDTQELIYRFRSDEVDEDGNRDNRVDQRLISRLIQDNAYIYTADVSRFESRAIKSRKVIIPYTIAEAFDEYQILFQIDAGDVVLSIPHDAWMNEVERQVRQYKDAPTIEVTVDSADAFYNDTMPNTALRVVSAPQNVAIRVSNNRVNTLLDYTQAPITYAFRTRSLYGSYIQNPIAYALNKANRWTLMSGNYEHANGLYTIATRDLGAYGVYMQDGSAEIRPNQLNHWSNPYKQAIDNKYTVLGLDGYNPNAAVSENILINIVDGMTRNANTIDVNAFITTNQMNRLYYSGVKKNRTKDRPSVTREEAIAMILEAIDVREGYGFRASAQDLAIVNGNTAINPEYRPAIAKAVTENLVADVTNLRPKANITYGELFALWAKAEEL